MVIFEANDSDQIRTSVGLGLWYDDGTITVVIERG